MENCKRNTKFPAVDEGNLSVIERLLPSAAFPHHIPDSGVGFTDSGGLSRIKRLRCRVIFFLQKFNFYRTIYFVRTDAHLHIDLCKFESFAYFIEFAPNFQSQKNKNDFSIFVGRKRWNTRNIAGHELKGRESFQQIVTLSSETAQRLKHFLNDLQHEKMTLEPGDQGGRHRREFFVGTKSLNVSST